VPPKRGANWKRVDLLDWLKAECAKGIPLIGFDFSFAFPFVDEGAYFPNASSNRTPKDPGELWQLVDDVCVENKDFYAGAFCKAQPWREYFHHAKGDLGSSYRHRNKCVERYCHEQKLGLPETVFKLIGAKQVGKGSLSGMRFLLALQLGIPSLAIWPFVERDVGAPTVVEVFPRLFLSMAGFRSRKVTSGSDLNEALKLLGSQAMPLDFHLPVRQADDRVDALVTSAGLRHVGGEDTLWKPRAMTEEIRRTEGWIFGVA
jgi:hypothetical protein